MSPKNVRAFQRSLLRWYAHNCRDLPWRRTQDAYAILVSEVMLQQTQAAAVVPYYNRWLRQFPTLQSLSHATESDVLKCWEGLGYYARARNLYHCARLIVEKLNGIFPTDPNELKSLPGIGRYTANAIGVFAFDQPLPVVEANTGRVLARLFNVRDPIDSSPGRRRLWETSARLVSSRRPRDFQNAMMDLGSLICIVRNPRCQICPVKRNCRVRNPASVPRKRKPAAIVPLIESHHLFTVDGTLLLEQSQNRWRGMWILPPRKPNGAKQSGYRRPPIHTCVFPFTNHRVTLRVYRERSPDIDPRVQRWFHKDELDALPIPSPHRRAINALISKFDV